MSDKVYLVYSKESGAHGFSSDWQDHRQFKIDKVFLDRDAADSYKKALLDSGRYSAYIEYHFVSTVSEY